MIGRQYRVFIKNFYIDHWLFAGGLFCLEYNNNNIQRTGRVKSDCKNSYLKCGRIFCLKYNDSVRMHERYLKFPTLYGGIFFIVKV